MITKNRIPALLAAVAMSVSASGLLALPATVFAQAPAASAPAASAPAASAPAAEAAAPATATSTPSTTPGATSKETVENPYGLEALWKGGDFVAKGTLAILVIMSMGSWYIIVTKLLDQMRVMRQAKEARNTFWKARDINSGISTLPEGSAFRMIAESGARSAQHDGSLTERVDYNTWISMSLQRPIEKVQSRLGDGLSFLATVGSTAPFIGLFGTVWGIYHALTAIGIAGQASIDKVAGPVGEALIMTAIGLAVAVPAVLGYNWLVRRNKSVMEDVRGFSSDLHATLLSGVMPGQSAPATATVKKVG